MPNGRHTTSCPRCRRTLPGWTLSPAAKLCVDEARLAGKWVRVGRVNPWRRLELMASWDVDSVDGTYLAFAPEANGHRLSRWLRGALLHRRQPLLRVLPAALGRYGLWLRYQLVGVAVLAVPTSARTLTNVFPDCEPRRRNTDLVASVAVGGGPSTLT